MSLPRFIVKKNILIPFLKQKKRKISKKKYIEKKTVRFPLIKKKIINEKTAF